MLKAKDKNNKSKKVMEKRRAFWLKITTITASLLVTTSLNFIIISIVNPENALANEQSPNARRHSDLTQIREALNMYKTERGSYPSSLSELESADVMRRVPEDPSSGKSYQYTTVDGNAKFCVGACMRGKENIPQNSSQRCARKLAFACEIGEPYAISNLTQKFENQNNGLWHTFRQFFEDIFKIINN